MIDFLAPDRLYWLLALIPLGLYLFWAEKLRIKRLYALGISKSVSHLRIALPLLIAALLMLALARPYKGFEEIKTEAVGLDIFVAVDVSLSMLAKDASPNRLEAAKRKVFDLIELSRQQRTQNRIGIIAFAGDAFRFCPLTSDLEIVRAFSESLSPDVTSSLGSSLHRAIAKAVATANEVKSRNSVVIVLSDGEDLDFEPQAIRDTIMGNSLSVWPIGIGESKGSPIPLRGGRYFSAPSGEIVITRLMESNLEQLADTGSGRYQRATLGDEDLRSILSVVAGEVGLQGREFQLIRNYNELGPALCLVSCFIIASLFFLKRPELIFSILIPFYPSISSVSLAEEPLPLSLEGGYSAYQSGDYPKAREIFSELLKRDSNNNLALQGLARTDYRLGDFSAATKRFEALANSAKNGREKYDALFNSGNSLLQQNKFDDAILRYDEALTVKPDDHVAMINREIALKLKEDAEKNQSSSSSEVPSSSPESSQSSSKDNSSQKNPDRNQVDTSEDKQSSGQQSSIENNGKNDSSTSQEVSSQTSLSQSSVESRDAQSSEISASPLSSSSSSTGREQAPSPSTSSTRAPSKIADLDSLEDNLLLPPNSQGRRSNNTGGQLW